MNIQECIWNIKKDLIRDYIKSNQKKNIKQSYNYLLKLRRTPISDELFDREVKFIILDIMHYNYEKFGKYDFQKWDWDLLQKMMMQI